MSAMMMVMMPNLKLVHSGVYMLAVGYTCDACGVDVDGFSFFAKSQLK